MLARRVEEASSLDTACGPLTRATGKLLTNRTLDGALGGTWLGHALHPLLTDFPLGMWMSTSYLDLIGGEDERAGAEGLLLGGIAAALPTMAAGWRDWFHADGRARRVGIVHATVNTSAWLLYTSSYVYRRYGRHRAAMLLAVSGGVLANVGGYLGGHLSLVLGVTLRENQGSASRDTAAATSD
ncbi:MAG: DUF2231 domain-containing protein [Candidatus Dormibacteria bacterium]